MLPWAARCSVMLTMTYWLLDSDGGAQSALRGSQESYFASHSVVADSRSCRADCGASRITTIMVVRFAQSGSDGCLVAQKTKSVLRLLKSSGR